MPLSFNSLLNNLPLSIFMFTFHPSETTENTGATVMCTCLISQYRLWYAVVTDNPPNHSSLRQQRFIFHYQPLCSLQSKHKIMLVPLVTHGPSSKVVPQNTLSMAGKSGTHFSDSGVIDSQVIVPVSLWSPPNYRC